MRLAAFHRKIWVGRGNRSQQLVLQRLQPVSPRRRAAQHWPDRHTFVAVNVLQRESRRNCACQHKFRKVECDRHREREREREGGGEGGGGGRGTLMGCFAPPSVSSRGMLHRYSVREACRSPSPPSQPRWPPLLEILRAWGRPKPCSGCNLQRAIIIVIIIIIII